MTEEKYKEAMALRDTIKKLEDSLQRIHPQAATKWDKVQDKFIKVPQRVRYIEINSEGEAGINTFRLKFDEHADEPVIETPLGARQVLSGHLVDTVDWFIAKIVNLYEREIEELKNNFEKL